MYQGPSCLVNLEVQFWFSQFLESPQNSTYLLKISTSAIGISKFFDSSTNCYIVLSSCNCQAYLFPFFPLLNSSLQNFVFNKFSMPSDFFMPDFPKFIVFINRKLSLKYPNQPLLGLELNLNFIHLLW